MLKVSACTGMPLSTTSSRCTQRTVSTSPGNFIAARQHSALRLAMRAGILVGALALPAMAQAVVIEFGVSGIVTEGEDKLRLFSDSGEAIIGKPYTMKFQLDIATLSDFGSQTGIGHGASNVGTLAPVSFLGEVTIGGRSFNWVLDPDSHAYLYLGHKETAIMESSGQYGWRKTYDVWSTIGLYADPSVGPYFNSLDFEQRIEFKDFVGRWGNSAFFGLTSTVPRFPDDEGPYVGTTTFAGTGTYALWQVRPVPEPGQVGMLLAGLALVAGVARRARRRA
ncbi:PEP-CTERM sorting domain-containing protein [Janthinobacterium fluminis]|uniref:PEP-CTERM sorting domain-containing protein n=1 Tax=Janthinobacterium fluminis TaxID=2987524 RepID=A0ABT5JXR5_9BURK|nr:PEP-CTERM sorting domain-containing protein [Janthinobacterium fluminis]MDC8756943.1 PEP-CTERM sorting domain-containing protein [Janthinobacterium fluminis]